MNDKAREQKLPRCQCGEVQIPNGWGGIETLGSGGLRKVHCFDRCAEMFVYDELGEIDPRIWDALR
jgi:hypothetical protein